MNSFTDGSAFCPGATKRVPLDSEKHRRVYTSSNVYHSHEWRVDTASGKTLKKRNACLHAVRQAVEKKIACTVPATSNSKAPRVTRRGFRVRAGDPRKIPASVRGSTRKVPCRVRRLAGPRRCPAQSAHCFVGCYGGLCCQSLRRKTGLLCSIKQRNAGVQMFFTHLATKFQR